ncbi:hypothetical protein L6164_010790 [Bauhinia variegata]|uniref:Uncharacterized protein n=1 Tax=Bauhinia variegata TaxID=167791 RepID=A0ACB9P5W0_BAUVA|nr:hypothetical protein L6164_010790 [Bauhinia variegata]
MEKEKEEINAASFTWWQDSHNRLPQSPWLQATLSDLDEKTKLMLSVIDQDDGDSFAKRAEMYYSRRSELLETIQDLHKSYCSLSLRYHHLTARYPMLHHSFKSQNQNCVGNSCFEDHGKTQESQGEAGAGAEKKLRGTESADDRVLRI